ncbi:Uma2 family endonuclease [Spirulina subsalsa FACHB-351]|uniref:Uma2 family endonuclease n=1 Tax=Spirulina subsalsa FACHB-351 TaxID=234711 RepID=A0ABT3LBK3_9CYAN|nr:Uma2 family endonuclease [Spirulina subsalsa]MCW6038852.1 Uma2 family endonuclease [Spirulina subsalsa FACHB-351]
MVQTPIPSNLLYPDSDGKPMAENTLQYRWIVRLVSNLKELLKDEIAFVAGDLLWYPVPVQRPPAPRQAPDAMVVLGRPDGDRGSYKQWEEDDISPQVVFEILSPSNTTTEMAAKQRFYEKYGVLEMYFYNPESYDFWGFERETIEESFRLITPLHLPWTSPLLNIRFELSGEGLVIYHPTGEPFKEPGELFAERNLAQQERDLFQEQRDRAFAKLQELGIDPETL